MATPCSSPTPRWMQISIVGRMTHALGGDCRAPLVLLRLGAGRLRLHSKRTASPRKQPFLALHVVLPDNPPVPKRAPFPRPAIQPPRWVSLTPRTPGRTHLREGTSAELRSDGPHRNRASAPEARLNAATWRATRSLRPIVSAKMTPMLPLSASPKTRAGASERGEHVTTPWPQGN